MKKILTTLALAIVLVSCSNKAAEEAAKLKEETFKLHDEVMPISMKLEDLKAEVMKKATADTTLKKTALEISSKLDKAYEGMETWMPKLGEAADMKDDEAKVKALTDLKIEGESIKQSTLEAKKQAEAFLK